MLFSTPYIRFVYKIKFTKIIIKEVKVKVIEIWKIKEFCSFLTNIRKKKSKILVINEGYAIWLERGKKSLQVDKKNTSEIFYFSG